ncbi:MAG TPA: alpha/beta hydrolase [Acidobacteriota bacterium]|nr:alpha/beta hydrolase [Acidobacteriota bacterium]
MSGAPPDSNAQAEGRAEGPVQDSPVRSGSVSTPACPRMHYTLRGEGPLVLFLHGFPTAGLLWKGAAERLSDRFTCLCPDLPGWGRSSPMAGRGLSLLDESVALLEALEAACGRPVRFLAATDAGAVLAAYYAAVRPEKVERLVLMSAPVWPDFNIPWPMRILRTPVVGEVAGLVLAPLMFWRLGLGGDELSRYTARHRASFSHPFRGPLGGMRLARRLRWGEPGEVMGQVSRLLPQIQARTLVVDCSEDEAVPLSLSQRSARTIPEARLLQLPGPHFLPLTDPNLVARHLSDFFSQP